MKRIIVIAASGIGCTIMLTPTLRKLRKSFPEANISLLGISKSFVTPVLGSKLVDEVLVFDFEKNSLFNFKLLFFRIKQIHELRKKKFDVSITAFPSNKWFFNVFAKLIGAKKRITHQYSTPAWKTLSWLQNVKIKAVPELHDVEQNLNLLKGLGVKINLAEVNEKLFFNTSERDKKIAEKYFKKELPLDKKIVGVHIGSSQDYKFSSKRWPTIKFAKLIDQIQSEIDAKVVVFAGPDDIDEVRELKKLSKSQIHVVSQPLGLAAEIMRKCDLLVSNDSGMMHVAVAMQTPVVAIFGPTNMSRTRPFDDKSIVIHDKDHSPILDYPFKSTSAKIDPEMAQKTFANISVSKVLSAVKSKLSND